MRMRSAAVSEARARGLVPPPPPLLYPPSTVGGELRRPSIVVVALPLLREPGTRRGPDARPATSASSPSSSHAAASARSTGHPSSSYPLTASSGPKSSDDSASSSSESSDAKSSEKGSHWLEPSGRDAADMVTVPVSCWWALASVTSARGVSTDVGAPNPPEKRNGSSSSKSSKSCTSITKPSEGGVVPVVSAGGLLLALLPRPFFGLAVPLPEPPSPAPPTGRRLRVGTRGTRTSSSGHCTMRSRGTRAKASET
mmetsp:Transcript_1691/g.5462  ORF Transcript_1691/g.5462 Transcript_1691/m.5462 type:complete len:255 (-) Transcript_1691:425-1189(-)